MASKMCIVCGGDLPCRYKHSQEDPTRRSLRLEREAATKPAPAKKRDSVPALHSVPTKGEDDVDERK